jgi:hypothetical protein
MFRIKWCESSLAIPIILKEWFGVNKFKQSISNSLINYRGLKTKRRIVVFESDDWGSVRMPSKEVFNKLKKAGIPLDNSAYCRFDSLESNKDLELLFEVLLKYKDQHGNHPVITANTVVANPNFEKIQNSKFLEYHYEPFLETLKKYPNHNRVFEYYNQGINEKIFFPQFHGREHVNIEMWLDLLKSDKDFQLAFENNLWGLSNDVFPNLPKSIQATFDSLDEGFLTQSIIEGLNLFEDLFGFRSKSFIANNFIWNSTLNNTLYTNGIEFLQGMKYQILPKVSKNKRQMIRHYFGEKNSFGQHYLIRNCSFEPAIDNMDFKKTIFEINNAFFFNKPAIISTHRINFIGNIDKSNSNKNLQSFNQLLEQIIKKWPNVEFMISPKLGELIKNNEL